MFSIWGLELEVVIKRTGHIHDRKEAVPAATGGMNSLGAIEQL